MNDERLDRLIHERIDGESTPEGEALLRRAIEARPDARARYEELLEVARALDGIPIVDPPEDLAPSVMRAVRGRAAEVSGREAWLDALRGVLVRRPLFAYGLTLAAGLVLGAFLLSPAVRSVILSSQDSAHVSGTALPDARLSGTPVDRAEISAEGLAGEVATALAGDRVLVRIRLSSRARVEVALEFDAEALSPLGFERRGEPLAGASAGPGRLAFEHRGEGEYWATLGLRSSAPAPIRLRVTGPGLEVEKEVRTRHGGSG